jgi:hypothetical protein
MIFRCRDALQVTMTRLWRSVHNLRLVSLLISCNLWMTVVPKAAIARLPPYHWYTGSVMTRKKQKFNLGREILYSSSDSASSGLCWPEDNETTMMLTWWCIMMFKFRPSLESLVTLTRTSAQKHVAPSAIFFVLFLPATPMGSSAPSLMIEFHSFVFSAGLHLQYWRCDQVVVGVGGALLADTSAPSPTGNNFECFTWKLEVFKRFKKSPSLLKFHTLEEKKHGLFCQCRISRARFDRWGPRRSSMYVFLVKTTVGLTLKISFTLFSHVQEQLWFKH